MTAAYAATATAEPLPQAAPPPPLQFARGDGGDASPQPPEALNSIRLCPEPTPFATLACGDWVSYQWEGMPAEREGLVIGCEPIVVYVRDAASIEHVQDRPSCYVRRLISGAAPALAQVPDTYPTVAAARAARLAALAARPPETDSPRGRGAHPADVPPAVHAARRAWLAAVEVLRADGLTVYQAVLELRDSELSDPVALRTRGGTPPTIHHHTYWHAHYPQQ